ncbi:DUF1329 domain-containing protein [Oceanobacter sp. 5_MG-2023]|uniref:DUF1329 domain-containing protein n=1 Tax=Oceanobacter sp. 5_MG-2023 TaxID=3062645 RepID=UPI0026E3A9F2|nr:DUF1329 domain-containing protein [Oceanobacter sp. 5_MG-2023]MDO6683557.1 DUF1329 domain-containing protein [Oceanobacter sp. 5_MG-2023]
MWRWWLLTWPLWGWLTPGVQALEVSYPADYLAAELDDAALAMRLERAGSLSEQLTPLGATRAGNGTDIPDWRGGLRMPPLGYQRAGQPHIDPFAGESALFRIAAGNLPDYRSFVTPGLQALLERYPDSFYLPVYPSRRTAAAPDMVYEQTYQNVIRTETSRDGPGFYYAWGGIPFPIPDSGVQAIWNHAARWQGEQLQAQWREIQVSGQHRQAIRWRVQENYLYYWQRSRCFLPLSQCEPDRRTGHTERKNMTLFQRQWSAIGAGLLRVTDQLKVKEGREYGYRRQQGAWPDGWDPTLRGTEDITLFSGSSQSYHWLLLGKRELYIPYNNYRFETLGDDTLLGPGHLASSALRFEKHRVWVVDGTLKKGASNRYRKRVYYIDEDSWQIALADFYGADGQLQRVGLGLLKSFYELPGVLSAATVIHDLSSGRYSITGLESGQDDVRRFDLPVEVIRVDAD